MKNILQGLDTIFSFALFLSRKWRRLQILNGRNFPPSKSNKEKTKSLHALKNACILLKRQATDLILLQALVCFFFSSLDRNAEKSYKYQIAHLLF